LAKNGDVVITMGAGSIGGVCGRITQDQQSQELK
jgi:UDP-N-acetylmuramate--alanine ligase